MKRPLQDVADEVHKEHVAGQLRPRGPMRKKPDRKRRRPNMAVLADLLVNRGTSRRG